MDVEDSKAEYGFGVGSKQHRFFAKPAANRFVALVFDGDGPPPTHLADSRVIVRLFGEVSRSGVVTLWHVSARKAHPLNDSARGTRWGVHGISRAADGTWRSFDGARKLTASVAHRFVRGSPNPYAVEGIVRAAEHFDAAAVEQHADMPCAKLFSKQYDQTSHPATLLLYLALGFRRPLDLEHYVWHRDVMPPMQESRRILLERMRRGESAIV